MNASWSGISKGQGKEVDSDVRIYLFVYKNPPEIRDLLRGKRVVFYLSMREGGKLSLHRSI